MFVNDSMTQRNNCFWLDIFMLCAITYSLSHADWFFNNINVNAYSASRKYSHIVELLVWWEKNSKINFSAGWYVYERSDIEYIIIYVNKTAIRIRCLIYWRGSRVGLFGRESEKKIYEKRVKLCVRRTERETRPCINPSHFQSEKWQPPRDGGVGQNTRYLHAYVSGDVWSASGTFLRETDRSIPPAAPGFLTAIWHGKHYNVTHRTPCFPMHILFPPFFFPENSFDMSPGLWLGKKLKKKNKKCIRSRLLSYVLLCICCSYPVWFMPVGRAVKPLTGLRLGANCGFPRCLYYNMQYVNIHVENTADRRMLFTRLYSFGYRKYIIAFICI